MKRPTLVEIDLEAFESNIDAVRQILPDGARLVAVLKADAYGHGAIPLANACARRDVAMIAVSLFEEALELSDAGVTVPMLILGPLTIAQIEGAANHGFVVGVAGPEMLRSVAAVATSSDRAVRVHLKLDSGMGRMGLVSSELGEAIELLRSTPQILVEAIYSHFATASDTGSPHVERQQQVFDDMLATLATAGIEASQQHFANSAAAARRLVKPGDLVRVGMLLYGGESLDDHSSRLEPIMRWSTQIARLKTLPPDSWVGYGATWKTDRESRIATIPVGYADGYPWALSNKADVLVRGRRAPVVGRVSMDLVTIDVTDIPGALPGDDVVLLGSQGKEMITAEELAEHCGTIPYEIFCRVGARVPRVIRPRQAED